MWSVFASFTEHELVQRGANAQISNTLVEVSEISPIVSTLAKELGPLLVCDFFDTVCRRGSLIQLSGRAQALARMRVNGKVLLW